MLMLALTVGMALLLPSETAGLRLLTETDCKDLCKGSLDSKCKAQCEGKSRGLRDSNPIQQPNRREPTSGLTTPDETEMQIESATDQPTP